MAYGREGILLEGSSFRLNCELGEAYFWEGLKFWRGLLTDFYGILLQWSHFIIFNQQTQKLELPCVV